MSKLAEKIASAIENDLRDRRGFRYQYQELDLDEEVLAQIREEHQRLVDNALHEWGAVWPPRTLGGSSCP